MSIQYLEKLPKVSYQLVRRIGALADDQGVSVYLVGGSVRDLILGRSHLDLDFVVDGDAVAFARHVGHVLQAENIKVHKPFGTAALSLADGLILDFATVRAESYPFPGSLPVVRQGTLREDLHRRDFTINAMALKINRSSWSELVDLFGGLKDLRAKQIRILHEQSFVDDSTRILRAIRFEQRFKFRIESKTLGFLKKRLSSRVSCVGRIDPGKKQNDDGVSAQRFFNEFKKILVEDRALDCLRRCRQLGAEKLLGPKFQLDIHAVKKVKQRIPVIIKKKAGLTNENFWKIMMMVVLEGQTFEGRSAFLSQLSLSSADRRNFDAPETGVDFLVKLCQNSLSSSGVYRLLKPLTVEQCLYLCCRTTNPLALKRIERFLKKDSLVELQIDGNDIKALGVTGARIKDLLAQTLYHKIDHGILSREQELHFVKNMTAAGR